VEQAGEYRLRADRQAVWSALNDPSVLGACIDGCESMEKTAAHGFEASVRARVGPVSATFAATLLLADVVEAETCTINADVKGGAAGFGKGTAHVTLTEEGEETVLSYNVKANVGGKLAQVGSRLIDGVARKMADDFFAQFRLIVDPDAARRDAETADKGAQRKKPSSGRWKIWMAVIAALVIAAVLAMQ
jgi:hypothetical protein